MPDQVLRQVREACAERPPRSQVISSSRYVFDLDQGVIRIEDRDFVFIGPSPEAGRYSHALTVPVKAINPRAKGAASGIHKLPEHIDGTRALLDGNPLAGAHLSLTEANGLKQLILDLAPGHEVAMGSRFRIDLNYWLTKSLGLGLMEDSSGRGPRAVMPLGEKANLWGALLRDKSSDGTTKAVAAVNYQF